MDRKDKSRKSAAPTMASMAALAAAAASGCGAGSSADDLPPSGDDDKKPNHAAAPGSVASSSSSAATARRGAAGVAAAAAAAAAGGAAGGPSCQAERCGADLSEAKRYHRRHKVCEAHSKSAVVLVAGLRQRFCQQCSRFHELSEFDDTKRSCRRRLAGHNERRRKSSSEGHGDHCLRADQDGRSHPGNPPLNHFQIR